MSKGLPGVPGMCFHEMETRPDSRGQAVAEAPAEAPAELRQRCANGGLEGSEEEIMSRGQNMSRGRNGGLEGSEEENTGHPVEPPRSGSAPRGSGKMSVSPRGGRSRGATRQTPGSPRRSSRWQCIILLYTVYNDMYCYNNVYQTLL